MRNRPEPRTAKAPASPGSDTRKAAKSAPASPAPTPPMRDDGKLPAEAFWKAAGRFQRLR